MVPYRGRLALRIARIVLSVAATGWCLRAGFGEPAWALALMGGHLLYAIFAAIEMGHETPVRSAIATAVDTLFFALWVVFAPRAFQPVFAAGYLLLSTALLHSLRRLAVTCAGAFFVAMVLPFEGPGQLAMNVIALGGVAMGLAVYKNYIDQRHSTTLRHNVIIRSQALSAREAERQRIAADFHDGPLQNFVGFQMRLELIRRMLERNYDSGVEELRSLQELCKSQVADLRSFVRSMRPPDEGMSLAASLARMADSLQRDTGINATFTGEELHDPPEVEVSLEVLQIVREAFHNIQKHSGATQVSLSAHRKGRNIEIIVEDNGAGFPFAGSFSLEELDAARLGPISIKRRVKALNGDLSLESRPGEGAKLTFRVPF